jgi:hypothetical protein
MMLQVVTIQTLIIHTNRQKLKRNYCVAVLKIFWRKMEKMIKFPKVFLIFFLRVVV